MKKSNNILFNEFKTLLKKSQIKIVSFDIFDTLVMRKVSQPTDVFLEMGKDKYVLSIFDNPISFKQLRITAENKARIETKKEEIQLEDIYQQISHLSSKQRNKLINIELKLESKLIFVNKEIVNWIKLAHQSGKKIILTSDMYLNKNQIQLIFLDKLKIKKLISEVYMSSEINKTKRKGSLFPYLLKKWSLDSSEMIHIGDNPVFDKQRAEEQGIKGLLYSLPKEFFLQKKYEKYFLKSQDNETESIRKLTVIKNPYTNNNKKFFFNFGASIGGPLFWSFSQWLIDLSLRHDIKQINCIMREGFIFHKYLKKALRYRKLTDRIEINLIYASRRSLFLPCLTKKDLDFTTISFSQFRHLTVLEFYKLYGVYPKDQRVKSQQDFLLSSLDDSNLNKKMMRLKEHMVADLMFQADDILKNSHKKRALFLEYIRPLNLQKNSILFDFGGNNTIASKISNLLSEDHHFTNVLFYRTQSGMKNSASQRQYTFIHDDDEISYKNELLRRSPDIFEILFNGTLATTIDYHVDHGKASAKLDETPSPLKPAIWSVFLQGIDTFYQLCSEYHHRTYQYDAKYILDLALRVIELPTKDEVKYLGRLPLNMSDDNQAIRPIISKDNIMEAKKIGLNQLMQDLHLNLWSYWKRFPWIQGVINSIEPTFLINNKYFSSNSSECAVHQLLEKIQNYNIKNLSIYGCGEFFEAMYPRLMQQGIKINYLIDSKPDKKNKYGIQIIPPTELIDKGEHTILIASVAFADEIKNKLNALSNELMILSFDKYFKS